MGTALINEFGKKRLSVAIASDESTRKISGLDSITLSFPQHNGRCA